jgi:glycosyltransferase involved in cell wall biosynthesis
LAGNRTSLPEIAGDAAVLVDPDSTDSIRDGLARLLSDDRLRTELVSKGAERLKGFTWAAAARALAAGFERAMG